MSKHAGNPTKLEIWTALALVYVVWGSTYVAIKLAVRTLPPLLTGGTRFLTASAALALILVVLRRSLRVTRREALGAAALGIMLLAGGVGSCTSPSSESTPASRR